jgi:hypothetical protein
MRNKFFFGVVVGFFVAIVAFVVFFFFSGGVKAQVRSDVQRVAVTNVDAMGVDNGVIDGVGTVEDMKTDQQMVAVSDVDLVNVGNDVQENVRVIGSVPHKVLVNSTVSVERSNVEGAEV